jgi:hypothetical protein
MSETPLQRLARRASAEPSFLGWQLAAFARARGLDDSALAAHLGCPVPILANVRLCGTIRSDHFRADVECVAAKFGLDASRLAEAAKPLPAEPPRGAAPVADAGVLLAARDRTDVR